MGRFPNSNRSTTELPNSLSASSILSPDPVLIDPCVKSSFGVLLRLQEVIRAVSSPRRSFILGQESPGVECKLEAVLARLERLRSSTWHDLQYEQRGDLFE